MPSMELFVLSGGVYNTRVLIYLFEKGLIPSPLIKITPCTNSGLSLSAPGKPPGTVPILSLSNPHSNNGTTYISQSLAIISYFEDLCDAFQSSPPYNPSSNRELGDGLGEEEEELKKELRNAKGSMRGRTVEERARTREIVLLVEEAMTYFSFACHKGSGMFSLMEEQNPAAARLSLECCEKTLKLVEKYYVDDHRFEDRKVEKKEAKSDVNVNVADCVLFSLLQFAESLYGVQLVKDLPGLKRFYVGFGTRESVSAEGIMRDEKLRALASHWIKEDGSIVLRLWDKLKVSRLTLAVIGDLVAGMLRGWFK